MSSPVWLRQQPHYCALPCRKHQLCEENRKGLCSCSTTKCISSAPKRNRRVTAEKGRAKQSVREVIRRRKENKYSLKLRLRVLGGWIEDAVQLLCWAGPMEQSVNGGRQMPAARLLPCYGGVCLRSGLMPQQVYSLWMSVSHCDLDEWPQEAVGWLNNSSCCPSWCWHESACKPHQINTMKSFCCYRLSLSDNSWLVPEIIQENPESIYHLLSFFASLVHMYLRNTDVSCVHNS